MPIDAFSVLCAQLTRDLLAIAKFLFVFTVVFIAIKLAAVQRDNIVSCSSAKSMAILLPPNANPRTAAGLFHWLQGRTPLHSNSVRSGPCSTAHRSNRPVYWAGLC